MYACRRSYICRSFNKNVINPLSQFLNTNSYPTYSALVQQMTDQNKYYGSIPSDLAPTPQGTNLVKETPFYKILERTSETPVNIGEELVKPWRQPRYYYPMWMIYHLPLIM